MTRAPTKMELRAAKALADALIAETGPWCFASREKDWSTILTLDGGFDTLDFVRVVIRALRDPGHDVTAAVVSPQNDRTVAVTTWNAMIDASSPP